MVKLFNDPELQARFERDGYAVMPFIDMDGVKQIEKLFYEMHDKWPGGFYATSFNPEDEFKQKIFDKAEEVLAPKVDAMFHDIKKLGGCFLVKTPGVDSKVEVHQDWLVVDEDKYCTITLWIPLVDTNEENGAIRVLPGSHKFFNVPRGTTIPVPYNGHQQMLWDQMITLPMKAGEVFILNHALLHASSPNLSNKERVVITYGLAPREAQMLLYHGNKEGKIEKYEMPDDMFQRYYNIGEAPLFGTKVAEFDNPVTTMSELKLHHLMTKAARERNIKPLFKEQATQEFFEKEGYVKLPVLDQSEVAQLLEFYNTLGLKDEAGFGFHISMDAVDKDLVARVLDKIYEVALPKASAHFKDAKAFVASFVIKESNPKGVVPVHQDWTFVEDESQHCSVTCWIPLVDTNLDNGALGVVRGSHKFFSNYRPSPSPQVPSPISEHMFTIFPYLQVIEMKAGEALIFDNRTFHGSPPNSSDTPRVAFGIGFTQKEAKLVHYYLKPGTKDTVLKYEIDEPFFRKYENSRLAKMYDKGELIEGYKMIGEAPYVLPKFTADELVELIKENGNEFNVPMCEKLAKLFNMSMDGGVPNAYGNNSTEQKQEEQKAPEPELVEAGGDDWEDRPFYKKYSPLNVVREIKHRLVG